MLRATSTNDSAKACQTTRLDTKVTAPKYFYLLKQSKGLQKKNQAASHKGDHTEINIPYKSHWQREGLPRMMEKPVTRVTAQT